MVINKEQMADAYVSMGEINITQAELAVNTNFDGERSISTTKVGQ